MARFDFSPKIIECPHEQIKVVKEIVFNQFGRRYTKYQVKTKATELARECVGSDIVSCIEIYPCGCLLSTWHDDITLDKDVSIIPSSRALGYLKDEVERRGRFKYLHEKYQKLFSMRNYPTG
jgi:uncharacterized protein involved in tolerance to divalent cations